MAKVKVAGNVMVLESEYTKKELETVQQYRPQLLNLIDDDKNVTFAVKVCGGASITKFGVEMNGTAPEGGKACVTIDLPTGEGDVKARIAEKYGPAIVKFCKVEEQVAGALDDISTERAAAADLIEVL